MTTSRKYFDIGKKKLLLYENAWYHFYDYKLSRVYHFFDTKSYWLVVRYFLPTIIFLFAVS